MKTLFPSRFSKKTLTFLLLTLNSATTESAHLEAASRNGTGSNP